MTMRKQVGGGMAVAMLLLLITLLAPFIASTALYEDGPSLLESSESENADLQSMLWSLEAESASQLGIKTETNLVELESMLNNLLQNGGATTNEHSPSINELLAKFHAHSDADSESESGVVVATVDGCKHSCGDHGRCMKGRCKCQKGWFGEQCQSNKCEQFSGACGEHGVCFAGECRCSKHWSGSQCELKARQSINEAEDGLTGPGYVKGWFDVSEQSGPLVLDEVSIKKLGFSEEDVEMFRGSKPGVENDYCRWVSPEVTGDSASSQPYLSCALAGSDNLYTPRGMIVWDAKLNYPRRNKCFAVTCNGRGACDELTGACECDLGWAGMECEKTHAEATSMAQCNGVDCGEHGSCLEGRCVCTDKYEGDRCQYRQKQREIPDEGLLGQWVDAQKQGVKNDYCRVIGTRSSSASSKPFVSCALAGSRSAHTPRGAFRFVHDGRSGEIDAVLTPQSKFDLQAAVSGSSSRHGSKKVSMMSVEDETTPLFDPTTAGCTHPDVSPDSCGTGVGVDVWVLQPQLHSPSPFVFEPVAAYPTPVLHGQCVSNEFPGEVTTTRCACFGRMWAVGPWARIQYGPYGGTFCEVLNCPLDRLYHDPDTVVAPPFPYYIGQYLRSINLGQPMPYYRWSISYDGPASPTLSPFGKFGNAMSSSVQYQCKPGLVPAKGVSMELKCNVRNQEIDATGKTVWRGGLNVPPEQYPRCVVPGCQVLPPADPLTVVYNDPTQITNPQPGTTATYTCPAGFIPKDGVEMTLTCDGYDWSAAIPTLDTSCEALSCPALEDPHGTFNPPSGSIGTTSTLTCDAGYFTVSTETTCTQERTWTGMTPVDDSAVPPVSCQQVTCAAIQPPQHGTVNGGRSGVSAAAGEAVTFACDAGYTLTGSASSTCQQTSDLSSPTGAWSNPTPTCVPNTCQPSMSAPTHGSVSMVGSTDPASSTSIDGVTGDVVQFTCDQGYLLTGQSTSACTVDGTWSPSQPPTCEPAQCPREWTMLSTALSANITTGYTNDVAGFSCAAGYQLNGPTYMVCSADGEWRSPTSGLAEPFCTPMACPSYSSPNEGVFLSSTTGNFGDMIVFSCATGYNLIGQNNVKCVVNSAGTGVEWTSLPTQENRIPQCWGALSMQGVPFSIDVGSSATFTLSPNGEVTSPLVVSMSIGSGATISPSSVTFVPGPVTPATITLSVPAGTAAGITDVGFNIDTNVVPPIAPPANSPIIFIDAGADPVGRCSVLDGSRQYGGGFGAGSIAEDGLDLSSEGGQAYPFYSSSSTNCFQQCSQHVQCKQAVYQKSSSLCYLQKNKYAEASADADFISARCLSGCPRLVPPADDTNLIINNPTGAFPGQVFPVEGQSSYFLCEVATMLDGDSISTCKADGTWDKPTPSCVPTPCATLNPSLPLQVSSQDAVAGETVSFSCAQGWHLQQDVSFKCGPNAANSYRMWWSNPADSSTGVSSDAPLPVCQPNACTPTATAPTNGVIHGSGTTGSSIQYACNEGYTLQGATSLKCTPTGWDGDASSPPLCLKNCPVIAAPDHGSLLPGAGEYHATQDVTVKCEAGYTVDGVSPATDSQVVSCTDAGSWSPIGPTFSCSPVSCPALPVNDIHLIVDGPRTTGVTGSVLEFSCPMGYTLSGSKTSTCVAGTVSASVWSSSAPVCIPNPCPDLTVTGPTDQPILSGVTGTVVQPTCQQGYAPVPATPLTCQATGHWDGSAPVCTPLPCEPDLTAPAHGSVEPTHGVTETRAVYTCSQGYTLVGNDVTVCLPTSQWSSEQPICQPNPCPMLDSVPHSLPHPSGGVTGDVVTIQCEDGYKVATDYDAIQCMTTGQWSNPLPTCAPLPCPDLPVSDSHLAVNGPASGGVTGNVVRFTCPLGYTLTGSNSTTCVPDSATQSQWTSPAPTCTPNPCPDLTVSGPTDTPVISGVTGTVVTPTCHQGYAPVPATPLTCQATGHWDGSAPVCTPLPCEPDLTAPAHGSVEPTHGVTETRAVYTCSQGYTLVGNDVTVCLPTSQWSSEQPICQPNPCPMLDSVPHSLPHPSGGVTGDVVTIQCEDGYKVATDYDAIQCMTTGQWNASVPLCMLPACPGRGYGHTPGHSNGNGHGNDNGNGNGHGNGNGNGNGHGHDRDGDDGRHGGHDCERYSWVTSAWSACTASCDGGSRTRSVTCVTEDSVVVGHHMCTSQPMPATQSACNTFSCDSVAASLQLCLDLSDRRRSDREIIRQFQQDVGAAAAINPHRVEVMEVKRDAATSTTTGRTLTAIDFTITPSRDPQRPNVVDVASLLQQQVHDPNSVLRHGAITNHFVDEEGCRFEVNMRGPCQDGRYHRRCNEDEENDNDNHGTGNDHGPDPGQNNDNDDGQGNNHGPGNGHDNGNDNGNGNGHSGDDDNDRGDDRGNSPGNGNGHGNGNGNGNSGNGNGNGNDNGHGRGHGAQSIKDHHPLLNKLVHRTAARAHDRQ